MLVKTHLGEGQKDVAAVLASAAFEDAMKRKATALGLTVDGKELSEITKRSGKQRSDTRTSKKLCPRLQKTS